jgi:hypothetical protein
MKYSRKSKADKPERIPWDRGWALASESFQDQPFGPHTAAELRVLIYNALIKGDANELQRFLGPIREERARIRIREWHKEGLELLKSRQAK